jgi:hypothetical protein
LNVWLNYFSEVFLLKNERAIGTLPFHVVKGTKPLFHKTLHGNPGPEELPQNIRLDYRLEFIHRDPPGWGLFMGNSRVVDPDIDISKGRKALISEMSDRVIL